MNGRDVGRAVAKKMGLPLEWLIGASIEIPSDSAVTLKLEYYITRDALSEIAGELGLLCEQDDSATASPSRA